MLAPGERQLYLEALRPPSGYRLDQAVGTTFSVDLLSLLAVPLSFAQLDWADDREGLLADPISLLRSLREHVGRITLFCQAGRIAMPARRHPLFTYLEPMVVEATAPHAKGEFHAKTWMLRFVGDDEAPVRYRFLNLSRNLTANRSWDTVLTLEGELQQRVNAIGSNHPLGEFIEALPALARRPLPEARVKELAVLAQEARRVRFEPPEPFEQIEFFPLGIDGHRGLDLEAEGASKLLIVSPFLTKAFLDEVAVSPENYLVSRQESLDELGLGALKGFKKTFLLDDGADLEAQVADDDDATSAPAPVAAPDEAIDEAEDPRGLHAKLYVIERGWDVEVITGSANATTAGFERNVEFLVQLTGKKSRAGIKALLGDNGGDGLLFGSLLQPYQPPTEPPSTSAAAVANEKAVEQGRRALSRAALALKASPGPGDGLFDLRLALGSKLELPEGVQGRCWPSTLRSPEEWNLPALLSDRGLTFERLSLQQLTAFLCVELVAGAGEDRRVIRFALALPLEGAPSDRLDQLLAAVLEEPGQFLRFLLFLLQDDGLEPCAADLLQPTDRGGAGVDRRTSATVPLLEDLLRVAARSPERLREVHRLVEDLKKTEAGRKVLPDGFEAVWGPVWTASGVTP